MSNNEMKLAPRMDSPLQHVALSAEANLNEGNGVEIRELAALTHIIVRGNGNDPEFVLGIQNAVGLTLPRTACQSKTEGETSIYWMSPDEWLIVSKEKSHIVLEADLRNELNGHFSLVDVSGAQTVIRLSGKHTLDVIKKSCPYDTDIESFPIGKVVGTVFAKSSVHMIRRDEHQVDLIVRRSFADYLCLWLQDASKEYGFSLNVGV